MRRVIKGLYCTWLSSLQVKELQRVSGAIVKTPDTKMFPEAEEVPVTIIGHFYASQLAQRRIRALMTQQPPRRGPQQNGI